MVKYYLYHYFEYYKMHMLVVTYTIDLRVYRYDIKLLKLVTPTCMQPLYVAVLDCIELDNEFSRIKNILLFLLLET